MLHCQAARRTLREHGLREAVCRVRCVVAHGIAVDNDAVKDVVVGYGKRLRGWRAADDESTLHHAHDSAGEAILERASAPSPDLNVDVTTENEAIRQSKKKLPALILLETHESSH